MLNCPHAKFFHQAEETMNGQEIRDRLLHSYERSYDIVKPSEVNGHTCLCKLPRERRKIRALKESRAVEDQLS